MTDLVNVYVYAHLDQWADAVYKALINMQLSFSLPWVSFTVHNVCHLWSVADTWGISWWFLINCFGWKFYHFPLFSFRNILYRLDERTSQFSILLEALEHCKLHQSNETLQAALSEVLNSINSAQVYFKAGLDVFENTLAGKKWEDSLHSKAFVYTLLNKRSTWTRISLRMKPFSTFLSVGA